MTLAFSANHDHGAGVILASSFSGGLLLSQGGDFTFTRHFDINSWANPSCLAPSKQLLQLVDLDIPIPIYHQYPLPKQSTICRVGYTSNSFHPIIGDWPPKQVGRRGFERRNTTIKLLLHDLYHEKCMGEKIIYIMVMGNSAKVAPLTICTYVEREKRGVIKGTGGEHGGKGMEEGKPFSPKTHNTQLD